MRDVLWVKIRGHVGCSEDYAFRVLGYHWPYSETGWAYYRVVDQDGRTWAVQVWRCTVLPDDDYEDAKEWAPAWCRVMTVSERAYPWAKKPARANPDLETDQ